MRKAIEDADVVMMLRIQQERQGKTLMPNAREYCRYFGLNPRNLQAGQARRHGHAPRPDQPRRRDVLLRGRRHQSHILKQVENGVAVRMAMLYHVCGGGAWNKIVEFEAAPRPGDALTSRLAPTNRAPYKRGNFSDTMR
jgi:aspartate carbamoyltransferase catalytic subunit